MWSRFTRTLMLLACSLVFVGCSVSQTPDLTLWIILYCGDDGDACRVDDDGDCRGRGRWRDLRDNRDIVVYGLMDKYMLTHEMDDGTYDEVNGICFFSEKINVQSSTRYRIYIEDMGPFDISKSTLVNQNWRADLVFND